MPVIYGLGPRAQTIYQTLRDRILSGELPPGDRLPSHTKLAVDFGVAPLTVRNVFAHLEREGLVARRKGKGTFVRDPSPPRRRPRRQAEEALREAEERFRVTFDLAAVGISHVDTQGRWLLVNQHLCDLVGYSRQELLQHSFQDITHPDDLAADLRQMSRMLAGELDSYALEKRYIRKDGGHVWVTLIVSLVRHPSGEPKYIISIVKDITSRKRTEEALRESEERFRATVEQAAVGIAHNALDGRWLLANRRLCDLYGYAAEELQKLRFHDLTHPDDLEADMAQLDRLLAGEIDSYTLEKRFIRKDRRVVWANLTLSLVRDSAGKPKYTIAIIEDITARKETEEALRASEEYLARIVETVADAVLLHNRDGRIVFANPAAEKILALQPSLLPSSRYKERDWSFTSLDGAPLASECRPSIQCMRSGKPVHGVELVIVRADGTQTPVSINAVPLRDAQGAVVGAVTSFRDVTERKRAEEILQGRARQHAAIADLGQRALSGEDPWTLMEQTVKVVTEVIRVDHVTALELIPDKDELLVRAGTNWKPEAMGRTTITGWHDTQVGYALLANEPVVVEDYRLERRFKADPRVRQYGIISGMSVPIHGHGGPFGALAVHTTSRRTFTRDDLHFLQAIANVLAAAIQRKRLDEILEYQALHDALTDLPNRTLLHDRLEQAILVGRRNNSPVSLLLMDLDRFKEVNDTFGHDVGDVLLSEVGSRLCGSLRESDTVARLGGDEFAILLPGTDATGASKAAVKVLSVLLQPFVVDGRNLDIDASIGIVVAPDHGSDVTTLLRRADVAMYAAKRTGGGYSVYISDQDEYSPSRLTLIGDLRQAIDREELALHYQPKVALKTGHIEGVEALVRWQHPQRGFIPPDQFIPLAEHTGLIGPLSLWVLRSALRQCRSWHDNGQHVPVCVNLSARSLHHPELVDTIARAVRSWAVSPSWLQLEITESAIMIDSDRALDTLTQLHGMGVKIAIDDFGTGYSSLAYLKRLPVDEIKIDRSFVTDLTSDDGNIFIARSIVDLAHNLGLRVVAEGVEDQKTIDLLIQMGCDSAQGYYLSHPVSAEQLTAWLKESHRRVTVA